MLQAQLKGKLTRDEENMEDLLVSNVFGSIKYLNPERGLLPILRSSENSAGDLPLGKLTEISDVKYEFWPWIQETNCNGCEPDVLITFNYPEGKIILLIEAKYLSGKSSEADGGSAPMDQLAREFDNLTEKARKENATPKLLYITAGFGYPTEEIEESKKEYLQKRGKQLEILWLSWRKIPSLLGPTEKDSLLDDLVAVLRKENLIYYEGISIPVVPKLKWHFKALPVNWVWAFFEVPAISWKFEKFYLPKQQSKLEPKVNDMSNEGEEISKLFKTARQICDQIGLLLRTADEQMLKNDFKSESNTALEGISYSILNSSQWVPTYAFRYYRHKDNPKLLAFISVLMDDDVVERHYSVKEPYVTAGILSFNKSNVPLSGNYWLAKYFGYMLKNSQAIADGTVYQSEPYTEGDLTLKYAEVFAQPLTKIKNANDIQDLIIKNLINLFRKECDQAS